MEWTGALKTGIELLIFLNFASECFEDQEEDQTQSRCQNEL
jgi:hypothetical protein